MPTMFIARATVFAAVAALVLLAGCGDDGPEPGVTAEFGDVAFDATNYRVDYYPDQRSRDDGNRRERPIEGLEPLTGRLQVTASSGDARNQGEQPRYQIAFTISGVDGPGTYELVRGDKDIQSFQLYAKNLSFEPVQYYAPATDEVLGTVTVEELNELVIAGTFDFTLPNHEGDTIHISNGVFRVEDPVWINPPVASAE